MAVDPQTPPPAPQPVLLMEPPTVPSGWSTFAPPHAPVAAGPAELNYLTNVGRRKVSRVGLPVGAALSVCSCPFPLVPLWRIVVAPRTGLDPAAATGISGLLAIAAMLASISAAGNAATRPERLAGWAAATLSIAWLAALTLAPVWFERL